MRSVERRALLAWQQTGRLNEKKNRAKIGDQCAQTRETLAAVWLDGTVRCRIGKGRTLSQFSGRAAAPLLRINVPSKDRRREYCETVFRLTFAIARCLHQSPGMTWPPSNSPYIAPK